MAQEPTVEAGPPGPIGTLQAAEDLLSQAFARPFDEQVPLLRAMAARVLPKLDDLTRADFVEELRQIPTGHATFDRQLSAPEAQRPSREVLDAVLRQPLGGQRHVLGRLATRVLNDLHGRERERLLEAFDRIVARATEAAEEVPRVRH